MTFTVQLFGTILQIAAGSCSFRSFSTGALISFGNVMSNLPDAKAMTAVERLGTIVHSMPSM